MQTPRAERGVFFCQAVLITFPGRSIREAAMRILSVVGLSIVVVVGGCRPSVQVGSSATPTAHATVRSSAGATLGVLNLATTTDGVHITGTLNSVPAGVHGIHLHAVGACTGTDFT